MKNKFTEDGSKVIVPCGVKFEVEKPWNMPLPDGLEYDGVMAWHSQDRDWYPIRTCKLAMREVYTHWLVRRPLPEPPRPKTREEKDREAFEYQYQGHDLMRAGDRYQNPRTDGLWLCWQNAITYARK